MVGLEDESGFLNREEILIRLFIGACSAVIIRGNHGHPPRATKHLCTLTRLDASKHTLGRLGWEASACMGSMHPGGPGMASAKLPQRAPRGAARVAERSSPSRASVLDTGVY